jgi:hypothetical protein
MKRRPKFALNYATVARIKNLSALWKVSQAEVVRRAVSLAQSPAPASSTKIGFEEFLRSGNGLDPRIAGQYLEEVREDRQMWREE